jgi:predicted transcriptional regulator
MSIFKDTTNKEKAKTEMEKAKEEEAKKAFEELVNEIKEEYTKTLGYSDKFPKLFDNSLKMKGMSEDDFKLEAGVSTSTMNRLISGKYKRGGAEKNYYPTMRMIITISVACELDMFQTRKLLRSVGLNFDETRKIHYAYFYIVTHCKGKSIEHCNNVLKAMGAKRDELLGERPRKKQYTKKVK